MNYLAHSFLSGDSVPILIGNFIADAVKGRQINKYDSEIKKGIVIHRQIDTFTDSHHLVKKSKNRLSPEYGKVAGIIMECIL
jgi:acyl carrier protein phosphodiesterase